MGKTSIVWSFFKLIHDGKSVQCLKCSTICKYHNSTTNLNKTSEGQTSARTSKEAVWKEKRDNSCRTRRRWCWYAYGQYAHRWCIGISRCSHTYTSTLIDINIVIAGSNIKAYASGKRQSNDGTDNPIPPWLHTQTPVGQEARWDDLPWHAAIFNCRRPWFQKLQPCLGLSVRTAKQTDYHKVCR